MKRLTGERPVDGKEEAAAKNEEIDAMAVIKATLNNLGKQNPSEDSAFQAFFSRLAHGGYPLLIATAAALIWANLAPDGYHHTWHSNLTIGFGEFAVSKSLAHWVDEALMTLFFFTVGLEIKREILVGQLSSVKQALLPIMAAFGGMVLPASIYVALNAGSQGAAGWGIPMATDIAFSLAILSLLGSRIPMGIKIFLTAVAIADDIGAVIVIALFYTSQISWSYLGAGALVLLLLGVVNLLWIRHVLVYSVLGVALWLCILASGIHATVAGVLVAFFVPAKGKYNIDVFIEKVRSHLEPMMLEGEPTQDAILLNKTHLNAVQAIDMACKEVETPLQRIEHVLESWISIGVLPLFALANAGLNFGGLNFGNALAHPVTVGIALGLVLGKPAGISLFALLSVRFLKTPLMPGIVWRQIIGVGFLAGIGFTMSLFINGLSFSDPQLLENAKLGIILASVIAATVGSFLLLIGPSAVKSPYANR